MSTINQDLQASHQILQLLEASKSRMDYVFDSLPGIFAVVNESGVVLKGNFECAGTLKLPYEKMLGQPLSKLFKKEAWNSFLVHFNKVTAGNLDRIQFELAIGEGSALDFPYFWEVRQFESSGKSRARLFSVIGRDISELRKAERQLAEIFASIPLGIFTVNRDCKVHGRYSTYLEWILGTDKIIGVGLKELLFAKSWDKLKPEQREGAENLMAVFGKDEMFYDMTKGTFPREVFLPIQGASRTGGRYIGVNYQPIAYEGKVEKLLVILEDRTELVMAKLAEENANMLNEQSVARIIQVKRCPEDILPLIVEEVKGLLVRAEASKEKNERQELGNALHGIKGNARIAGFEFLASIVHNLESILLNRESDVKLIDWDFVGREFESIKKEWDEIEGLYRVLVLKEGSKTKVAVPAGFSGKLDDKTLKRIKHLFERYNALLTDGTNPDSALLAERIRLALLELTYVPLRSLEDLMKLRASETCKQLGKSVMVDFDWTTIHMDEGSRNALSEGLLHIVNNAISHGIEDPSLRINAGKAAHGTIRISAKEAFGRVRVLVQDDGAGVNVEKVKSLGLKRRLITLEESLKLSKYQVMQLIFKPGFSTADSIDAVSGRGVGLDAVVASLIPFQGRVHVEDGDGGGAKFVIEMNTSKRSPINRHCVSFKDFLNLLETAVAHTVPEEGIQFNCASSAGILYADAQRVLLALTTLLGHYYKPGVTEINIDVDEYKKIHFKVKFHGKIAGEQNSDFSLPQRACEDFIEQHSGQVVVTESGLDISFGYLLTCEQIPVVKIVPAEDVALELMEKTMVRVHEAAQELNLNIELLKAGDDVGDEISLKLAKTLNQRGDWVLPLGSPYKLVKKQLLTVAERMMGVTDHQSNS